MDLIERLRAEGLIAPMGPPRKGGDGGPSNKSSRRKSASIERQWSPDAIWLRLIADTPIFATRIAHPPQRPIFLRAARLRLLSLHKFTLQLLWWSTVQSECWSSAVRLAASEGVGLDIRMSAEFARELAAAELGTEVVERLDDALLRDGVSNIDQLRSDLTALRVAWLSTDQSAQPQ
jgi:hypothetical protein